MNLSKVDNKDTRKRHWQRVNAHCNHNDFRDCFHYFLHSSFSWERFIFSKISMELLMGNKGEVMNNYTINLKFTVLKARLKILCQDLQYFLYCRFDLHYGMSRDWGGEVSWFVQPLSLSQLCQPGHRKQFIKKSNSKYTIFKTKDKFLTTTVIIFSINKKTRSTYFKTWCQMVEKRQTYLSKPATKNCCLF